MLNNKKNIIFLGAGASCAEGAPTQVALLKKAFECNCHKEIDPSGHLGKYFKKFWDIDIENINGSEFPTFEEVLGILELARNRHEAFVGYYSKANCKTIDHTIEDLIYLIVEVLEYTLKGQNVHHNQLISNLNEQGFLLSCSFISLNYDILIDNALVNKSDICDLDYGFDFINYDYPDDVEKWNRPIQSKAVNLFKIHGSLNWLYCPVCNRIKITPKTKGAGKLAYIKRNDTSLKKCNICEGTLEPILIPPTYYKNMSNYHIASVGYQAEQTLMNCEKIIFCGYSLPDADMHIKYMLKRGIMNRKHKSLEITVINNHEGKEDNEKKLEKIRFQRLLGKKVQYTDKSFKDFAANPADFLE